MQCTYKYVPWTRFLPRFIGSPGEGASMKIRILAVLAGIGFIFSLASCAPDDPKVQTDWQKSNEERDRQKTELTIDEYRGLPEEYARYALMRVQEAKRIFELVFAGMQNLEACQNRKILADSDIAYAFRLNSNDCSRTVNGVREKINAREFFDIALTDDKVAVYSLDYQTDFYDVYLTTGKKDIKGEAHVPEKRKLEVKLSDIQNKNLVYRFIYRVSIDPIVQSLKQNSYEVQEYDGTEELEAHGFFIVSPKENRVTYVTDLQMNIERLEARHVTKKEGRKVVTKFTRHSELYFKISAPPAAPLQIVAFNSECGTIRANVQYSLQKNRGEYLKPGKFKTLVVDEAGWKLESGRVVPHEVCLKTDKLSNPSLDYSSAFLK